MTDGERRARLGRRHGLAARYPDIISATRGMTALHATEPASIHLALRARVKGVTVDLVEKALYEERSIIKQGAMRSTLFAFPRDLLPAAWGSASRRYARAFRTRLQKDLVASGITDDGEVWLAEAGEAVVAALRSSGAEVDVRQLRALVPMIDVNVERSARTKWGGSFAVAPQLLAVLNGEARITRGHNGGHWRLSKPRWTTTEAWLGEMAEPWGEREGWTELVRRWLQTFGPGTEADLRWWLGGTFGAVRTALADLEAVPVSLDGGGLGWLLHDDLDEVSLPEPWVALLPTLDPTTMGWTERGFYFGPYAADLIDSVGNAGTTAWADGRIVGCWIQDDAGRAHVHLLEPVDEATRRAFDREAKVLSAWLDGVKVVTIYVSAAMRAATRR